MLKICLHCDTSFETENRHQKYCNRDCYQFAIGRFDKHKTCTVCAKEYVAYSKQSKYCSSDCYNSTRSIPPRTCPACGKLHAPKDGRVTYCSRKCSKLRTPDAICSYCSATFHPITVSKSKYCSPDCYHASMASEYPRSRLNFSKKEKRIILERDNHRCVECGSADNLEIDHIFAICNGGIRSIENGQTLCVPCHDEKTVHDKALARIRTSTSN